MKISFIKKKLPIILLSTLFIVTSLEIVFYFYKIYIPASFNYAKSNSYPLQIPAISQLIKPTQITSEDMSLEDAEKKFYPDNLNILKAEIEATQKNSSSFIKYSDMNYIYSGTIKEITTTQEGNINLALYNNTGKILNISFSTFDLKQATVFLILVSEKSPSHTESKLNNAQKGDYLILKRSADLLKNGDAVKTEIEIYRKALNG